MSNTADFHPAYFQIAFRTDGPVPQWPERFVIITAYATTGESWSEERNVEADRQLHAHLVARGHEPIRITGFDPESGHAEPGWAVELPLHEALEVGRLFLQDSIFRVDGDVLTVGRCVCDAEWATVGGFRERVTRIS
jgi:hypothetical protein